MGIGTKLGIFGLSGASFSNTYSIAFDGSDDYIDCGDNDNLSFGDGSTDSAFSISSWVKFDTTGTSMNIVSKYLTYPNGEYYLAKLTDGTILFRIISQNNELNRRGRITNSIDSLVGQWVHVVATYSGNSDYTGIKIYVNGVSSDVANNGKNTYVAMSNTTNPLKIGLAFSGNIDETAIFNSELSASDALAIYNSGTPLSLDDYSPVGWWRFEEGSGTTATDSGTGGNDGTLTNGPTYDSDVP